MIQPCWQFDCGWNQVLSCWVRSPKGWAQTGFFPFKCVFSSHSQPLHPHSKGEWSWSKRNWCCHWAWVWAWTVSSLAGVGDLDSWCNTCATWVINVPALLRCPLRSELTLSLIAELAPQPLSLFLMWRCTTGQEGLCAVLSTGWDMDCGSPRQRLVPFLICFLYKQQYISCPCPAQMPCWSDLFSVWSCILK